jgi:branched-subunit amino acid transport protein
MSGSTWAMIALIAAGTVAIKSIGPVALGGRDLPPRLAAVVACLAPSLLAALVVVDLFGGEDRSLSVDESLFGVLAAGVALVARLPMVAVVAIAAGVTAAVRALA